MKLRLFFPLLVTAVISQADSWIPILYSAVLPNSFHNIGKLSTYQTSCSNIECSNEYKVTLKDKAQNIRSQGMLASIGAGRFYGDAQWFCTNGSKEQLIHESGAYGTNLQSGEMYLYQTAALPFELCNEDIVIRTKSKKNLTSGNPGWKSGALAIGSTSSISALKNISDFFSSYIRALLGLLVILFVLFEAGPTRTHVFGSYWHRTAGTLLAIHFIASSSVLDFMVPGLGILGFPLLRACGSAGFIAIILSINEIISERQITFRIGNSRRLLFVTYASVLTLMLIYWVFQGGIYTYIQSALAITTLFLAARARTATFILTSVLFIQDLLAIKGILPGFPTNTATHFFIVSYIYDSFEWTLKNNSWVELLTKIKKLDGALAHIIELKERFNLGRVSYSYFTRDGVFKTMLIQHSGKIEEEYSNSNVPSLSASVMTSRSPLLRAQVKSKIGQHIKSGSSMPDLKRGTEYCILPLIHAERVIGTLNITSYSPFMLADPKQLTLLLSLLEKLNPRLSELIYKSDLSPNVEEERILYEMESRFVSNNENGRASFIKSMDAICKQLDIKVIISRKVENEDKLETYSNHNYFKSDENYLDLHSPKLSNKMITSPANLSFTRNEEIFVNDVTLMFPVYSEFLVSLLKRNNTRTLFVSPILSDISKNEPWGVVWIEFTNKLQRPDSDMRDLAQSISKSTERKVQALLAHQSESKLKQELGSLLPAHVLQKLEKGENPREEETGFILNIDLTGSTKTAKSIGDIQYAQLISEIGLMLSRHVSTLNFTQQMIIWDAFIYTRPSTTNQISNDQIVDLERELQTAFAELQKRDALKDLSFRAILHYGDTTRDLKQGSTKTWGIVGTALAESCKIEANMKHIKGAIVISDDAKEKLLSNDKKKAS